jgi:GNAT superfamily N-acetyltransferase
MKINVRKGEKKDLPSVLALIRELAEYEKAKDEVVVTVEQMEEWAYGPGKIFDFFVVTGDDVVLGMALYYYKYSTWKGKCLFLEDLIVTQEHRYRGFGTLLFEEVLKVAKAEKVKRLEWQVLDWNAPAIAFYKKYNSIFDPEWVNCKLTDEHLHGL